MIACIETSAAAALFLSFLANSATADPLPSPANTQLAAQLTTPAKHETPRELLAAIVPQPTSPPSTILAPNHEQIRHIVIPFHATNVTSEQICVTPCEAEPDQFSTYRVAPQNECSGSHPFTLPQQVDALRLSIDSGGATEHRGGQATMVLGFRLRSVGGSLLLAAQKFRSPSDGSIAGAATGGSGVAPAAVGIPLAAATESRSSGDNERRAAKVYNERGYAIRILPDIKLSKSITLTQRGVVF
jgi:hypothetical protein